MEESVLQTRNFNLMREGTLHPVSLSQDPNQDVSLSNSVLFQFFKITLYFDFLVE